MSREEWVIHLMEQTSVASVVKHQRRLVSYIIEETRFLGELEERMEQNERQNNSPFASFTELELIYYYINKRNHMDRDKSPETKEEYARDLLQFYGQLQLNKTFIQSDVVDFEEEAAFRNLRKRHIRRYQAWLKEDKQYAIATRARKVIVIKGFLKWLFENDYMTEPLHAAFINNEVRFIEHPNRDLSYREVRSLLDYYKNHAINFAILSLLTTTGLRVREIANAQWNDLYYDSHDDFYYLKVITKGKKEREAIIFDNVFERIQAFRKRRRVNPELDPHDDGPVLMTNTNQPYHYKYLSQYVTRIIQNSKLPFLSYKVGNVTPHWFRHFFAIYSLQQGASVAYIQQTLGHEDIRTTQIYLDRGLKKKNNVARLWSEDKF